MSIDWREWPQGNVPSEHRPRKDEDYLVFLRNGLTRVAYLDDDGEWRDTTTEVTVSVQWDSGVLRWAMIDEPGEAFLAPPSPREVGEGSEREGVGRGFSRPQWTPGPWEVQVDLANRHVHQVTALRGACSIARTSPWLASDSATESNANAHLIKMAPELCDALEHLVNTLDLHGDPQWHGSPMEQRCRVILAKARGEGA